MKWWEKTVEYFFIRNFVGNNMQIAPLDGKEERAGDAIFSRNNNWILIEFKKDKTCLKSEEDKFNNYEAAKKNFVNHDNHHYLIFGEITNVDGNDNFGLKCKTYFTRTTAVDIETILASGIALDDFISYLEEFTSYKKVKDGSDGGIDSDAFGLVAAINSDNEIVECISLAEMGKELEINLSPLETPPTSEPSFNR